MLEVEDTLSFMRRSPALFPIAFRDRRKAFLKTFPFQITFVQVEDILVVLGITHTSRDPSNWQGRLLPSEGRRRN